ncbi:acetyltransferase [Ralstonia insidiosa]|uniref:acetyltransferase n=1 Tax=Ralstonia insidiosa TaxID=190721 RepID=UPI0009EE717B|nr:acetyltransferase [Ralstonia insidiosa]KAB0472184.1 acetyltransferase [Ralstonia insidiosa]MBY4908237.1 acetyltransferase [Ralstonia insidiosa]
MTRLALFGAGGHGKVVADAALKAGWSDIVFFDDAWPQRTINGHWPVAGNFDALMGHAHLFESVHVSIGNCSVRWRKQQELRAAGVTLATVVHPQACVSQFAQIGAGSVVMAGAVVNVDTVIGEACIINTGVTVDHDCHLAAGVHVCPGAHLSGGVTVGARSWIGVGAVVRQGISIGADTMIGAGAVIVKAVGDGLTMVGFPATPMRQRL